MEPSRQSVMTVHGIACNTELLHLAAKSPQLAHSVGCMLQPSINSSSHCLCESIPSPIKFRASFCLKWVFRLEVRISETTSNFKHTHQTMLLTTETSAFLICNFLFQQDCQWNDILTSPWHELAYLKAT